MPRENRAPNNKVEFVTWESEVYPGLSLDNVPKPYHNEAEKLLDVIEHEPIDFLKKIESYKKEIKSLDNETVALAVWNTIKEGEEAGTGSVRYRARKEKTYLHVVHNLLFRYNKDEDFKGSREDTYLDITRKIDIMNDQIKDLG